MKCIWSREEIPRQMKWMCLGPWERDSNLKRWKSTFGHIHLAPLCALNFHLRQMDENMCWAGALTEQIKIVHPRRAGRLENVTPDQVVSVVNKKFPGVGLAISVQASGLAHLPNALPPFGQFSLKFLDVVVFNGASIVLRNDWKAFLQAVSGRLLGDVYLQYGPHLFLFGNRRCALKHRNK